MTTLADLRALVERACDFNENGWCQRHRPDPCGSVPDVCGVVLDKMIAVCEAAERFEAARKVNDQPGWSAVTSVEAERDLFVAVAALRRAMEGQGG